MPKDESNEKHIESLTRIRNQVRSAGGSLTVYQDLHQKYGEVLRELRKDLEVRLGDCLLRRHDDDNPLHLQDVKR